MAKGYKCTLANLIVGKDSQSDVPLMALPPAAGAGRPGPSLTASQRSRIPPLLRYTAAVRKRVQIALAILLVAVIGVSEWQVLRVREPVYQGKPLSGWLEGYDSPKNQQSWRQTDEAIRQIGPKAIPTLLQMLRVSESAPWKQKLLALAYKQHFIKIITSKPGDRTGERRLRWEQWVPMPLLLCRS